MELDEILIQAKIDIIERNLDFLEQYKKFSIEDFLGRFKDIQAVKYSLLEIIEACIDIASHLISINEFQRPKTYPEMFELLGIQGIINPRLSNNLADIARFRNLLVHSYADIDNRKLLLYIKQDLDNVREYIKTILNLV